MLTAIVHALFNSSVAAAFSYLLIQWTNGIDALRRGMVPVALAAKTGGPVQKGLATQ